MIKEKRARQGWVIRSGKKCAAHELFMGDSVVALAAQNAGDLSEVEPTRCAFKTAVIAAAGSDTSAGRIGRVSSTLFRFIHEMKNGDIIVYPSTSKNRQVNIGLVRGGYEFRANSKEFPHQRPIQWLGAVERDSLRGRPLKETTFFFQFYRLKQAGEFYERLAATLAAELKN